MAREIQAAAPGSELVVIPNASHLSNLEQPDAFNQALMAGPLIILYEVGIICARIFGRKPASPPAESA